MKENTPSIEVANTCLNCLHIRGDFNLEDHLYCSQYGRTVRYTRLHTCAGFTSDNQTCDEE